MEGDDSIMGDAEGGDQAMDEEEDDEDDEDDEDGVLDFRLE